MNHGIVNAIAATLLACLGGCVAFEEIPATALGCDPRLAGRWVPDGMAGADVVDVDSQCRARFPNAGRSGRNTLPPRAQLRGFALDGKHYLAFEKGDIARMTGLSEAQLASSDLAGLGHGMFLLRYRIEDDVLHAAMVDLSKMGDAIDEGEVPGREVSDSLLVVTGDREGVARLLRSSDLFVASGQRGAVELKRLGVGARP